jgi:two-component system copper resistance phosphate regulon response regulator CusR
MKLLVAEDEPKTARFLKRGLSEAGFLVDVAEDGLEAFRLVQTVNYDLCVLDIMMPGIDGLKILSWMRQLGRQTPVLFLTARDSTQDRVAGLELGADDYLVKPFAFSELLARIRTVLRRSPQREPNILRVADLEIDVAAHSARRSGQKLDLTAREFALLALLARRSGDVLTRTFIAENVWNQNSPADTNVVDVSVRRLRLKMDDPFPKKLIRTVRGVGYVLEAPE